MIKSVKKIVGAVKFLTIVMVLTALMASCKSTKKIQAAIAKKDSTSMFITNGNRDSFKTNGF
jgi:hypothetical protein